MTLPIFSLIRSKTDIELSSQFFPDSFGARLSLFAANRFESSDLSRLGGLRWIDLSLDFVTNLFSSRSSSQNAKERTFFIEKCKGEIFGDKSAVVKKQNSSLVGESIGLMIQAAQKHKPNLLGVPQYPYDNSKGTCKANEAIVTAISTQSLNHRLVLPVIILHRDWTQYKPKRREIIQGIESACATLKPEFIWIVDGSLNDDEGAGTLAKERLPSLIKFHQELKSITGSSKVIAGPYWGMNLVLWARGLSDYIAITPGGSSQYYAECGIMKHSASVKVAIPPLRRVVRKSPELKAWMAKAVSLQVPSVEAVEHFSKLDRDLGKLDGELAKRQIADFYSNWLKKICSLPLQGRAFGLYQDLSSAYALGSLLPKFESEKGPGANASHVAEALMLNVLG